MKPEKLAKALSWKETIQSFFEAIEERANQLIEAGVEVPGYKLVEGVSRRKWVS